MGMGRRRRSMVRGGMVRSMVRMMEMRVVRMKILSRVSRMPRATMGRMMVVRVAGNNSPPLSAPLQLLLILQMLKLTGLVGP
jgi:hypothetical protein